LVVGGNRYDRRELAGAFGDLGTLVPFVVGYVTINRLVPRAVLLGFGLIALATGLYFRTPISVQPMKAIATVAVTQASTVSPAMMWASGLVTGVFWLAMALTGAVSWVAALTSRPVVRGLVLGLGLSFILEGVNLMQRGPALAIVATALTFLLLGQTRLPAMPSHWRVL
jgi:Molybdate transporter of MFS superfamily